MHLKKKLTYCFDTYTASSFLSVIPGTWLSSLSQGGVIKDKRSTLRQGKEENLTKAWSMLVSPPRNPRVRRKVLPGDHADHRPHDIATVVLIWFHPEGKLLSDVLLPHPWSRASSGFRLKRHLRRHDFCQRIRPRSACRIGHRHSLCLTRVNRSVLNMPFIAHRRQQRKLFELFNAGDGSSSLQEGMIGRLSSCSINNHYKKIDFAYSIY